MSLKIKATNCGKQRLFNVLETKKLQVILKSIMYTEPWRMLAYEWIRKNEGSYRRILKKRINFNGNYYEKWRTYLIILSLPAVCSFNFTIISMISFKRILRYLTLTHNCVINKERQIIFTDNMQSFVIKTVV